MQRPGGGRRPGADPVAGAHLKKGGSRDARPVSMLRVVVVLVPAMIDGSFHWPCDADSMSCRLGARGF